MSGRAWKAFGLALSLAGLVHCTTFAGATAEGSSSSDLVEGEDAGHDAGDAGDAGDGGDAGDAGDASDDDAGDAAADAEVDADVPDAEVDAAPPKKPQKPVEPGDASNDSGETDLASRFPDPSTVHLGPLPDGDAGCAFAPHPNGFGAPIVAMIALASLRRRRRRT